MRTLILAIPCALTVLACGQYEAQIKPLAGQFLVLGVRDESGLVLSDLSTGVTSSAWLSSEVESDALESSLVSGQTVMVRASGMGTHTLADLGGGAYLLEPADAGSLVYTAGASYSFAVNYDGVDRIASVTAPAVTGPSLPSSHSEGEDLSVTLSDGGNDGALVLVWGPGGSVSYAVEANDFASIRALAEGQEMDSLTVPGEVFDQVGTYALGVAGLNRAREDDFQSMESSASSLFIGAMEIQALEVE